MAAYFFDTSGLVKRFAREIGSAWVINLLKPSRGHAIYLARITSVEVIAALTRRLRTGSLTPVGASKGMTRFERNLSGRYIFVEIQPLLVAHAMNLAKFYALRGYDAVQLAAALTVNDRRLAAGADALTLISADDALNAAAVIEGLLVDNPNQHP